ncbi:MAG: glycerophosphodiester phosphodiesterase [Candidatus Sumerlaeaceae bacterium]|nr:glycerophosphodiester phosphodiesterase [Candidatus Sumerlaeaceae bacterium]
MKRYLQFILVSTMVLTTPNPAPATEIIAHRGSSNAAPENTVAAANLAWQQNADAVELDIHQSADGRIIVIHDDTTSRTAKALLKVKETSSSELRALDAGTFKDKKYAGEKLPFLEEMIATVPSGAKRLFVEVKCGKEVLPELKKVLEAGGKMKQMVIIGFDFDTMVAAKAMFPKVPVYWLRGTRKEEGSKKLLPHDAAWIPKVKSAGLDGLDVGYAGITPEFAKAVKEAGLGLYAWTVDDPDEAQRLKSLGVDGITTNRPDLIRKTLE